MIEILDVSGDTHYARPQAILDVMLPKPGTLKPAAVLLPGGLIVACDREVAERVLELLRKAGG